MKHRTIAADREFAASVIVAMWDGKATHLKHTVPASIQGSLELQHISILLRVYVLIWKVDRKVFQLELHFPLFLRGCVVQL